MRVQNDKKYSFSVDVIIAHSAINAVDIRSQALCIICIPAGETVQCVIDSVFRGYRTDCSSHKAMAGAKSGAERSGKKQSRQSFRGTPAHITCPRPLSEKLRKNGGIQRAFALGPDPSNTTQRLRSPCRLAREGAAES